MLSLEKVKNELQRYNYTYNNNTYRCIKTFESDFEGQKININNCNKDEITSTILELLN